MRIPHQWLHLSASFLCFIWGLASLYASHQHAPMFNDTPESESNCRHKALVSFIDYNFYCTWKIRYGLVKIFHFLNPCLCLKLVLLMERSCDVILRVISPPPDLKVSVIIWTNYSGLGRYIQIRYDKLFRCISPVLTRQDIEINAQTWRGI